MSATGQKVAAGLLLAFWATEAVASKYIGPKSVEVTCVVERVLDGVDGGPDAGLGLGDLVVAEGKAEVRFALAPAAGEQVVSARVETIDAFDANGWRPNPAYFVPGSVRVAVPGARARKGERLHVHLDFAPGYDGKEQSHVVITPRLK